MGGASERASHGGTNKWREERRTGVERRASETDEWRGGGGGRKGERIDEMGGRVVVRRRVDRKPGGERGR
jgi:hypothetical protein